MAQDNEFCFVQRGVYDFVNATEQAVSQHCRSVQDFLTELEQGLKNVAASAWRGDAAQAQEEVEAMAVAVRQIGVAVSSLILLEEEMILLTAALDVFSAAPTSGHAMSRNRVSQQVDQARATMRRGSELVKSAELLRSRFLSLMRS